jgi:hypothetical protein
MQARWVLARPRRPRIFPRRADLRFTGAIHERLVHTPRPDKTVIQQLPEICLIHYGYDVNVYQQRSKDATNTALLEQELARGSEDPRVPFFLLEQHTVSRRDAEAVATFKVFAQQAARMPVPFWIEAYSNYLLALTRLDDLAKLEAAVDEAAERGMLGAFSLNCLSGWYAQRGDLDRAIDYLDRLVNQPVPAGLRELEALAGWRMRLKLAALYQLRDGPSDAARQALEHAESTYAGLLVDRRGNVALEVADAALQLNQLDAAVVWAGRAVHDAPETDLAQRQVLDLLVRVYERDAEAPVRNPFEGIDRALASADLQTMYDLAFALPLTLAGVMRSIAVVERLHAADEHEAALGLLNRTLDGPRVEQVYWLLIKTLTDLGRIEDAQLALQALRSNGQQLEAA